MNSSAAGEESPSVHSSVAVSPNSAVPGVALKQSYGAQMPIAHQMTTSKTFKTKRVFKVIIIGDAGVGKTCLSFRFCNGRFPVHTEATIGVDFRERSIVIDGELIRSMVAHYYRNVNAVVFVYDLTNPASFAGLSHWITECRKNAVTSSKDTPHILVGNKCDLAEVSRVKMDEAQMFADRNDMPHFETSALADSETDHVESIFMTLVHKLKESKPMHVQTESERKERDDRDRLLLRADDAAKQDAAEQGWCC